MDALPSIGDAWIDSRYEEGATVVYIAPCDNDVASTTAGDPKDSYNFYIVEVEQSDPVFGGSEIFKEYIAIVKDEIEGILAV